jgi:hypothetical protein
MANLTWDMPPWILDHVAARRKDQATTPVRTPTTIPDTVEAMAPRTLLLSAGGDLAITLAFEPAGHRFRRRMNAMLRADGFAG